MFEPNADRLCRCKKIAKIKRPQFLVVLAIRPRGVGADDWRIRTEFWELRRPWRVQCAPCGADKCARMTLLKQHRTTFTKCRSFSFVKCLWEKKISLATFLTHYRFRSPFRLQLCLLRYRISCTVRVAGDFVMSVSVRLAVCLSVFVWPHLRDCRSDLQQIFCACYLWPSFVLLWRRSDMLGTSGFMDDVILHVP